jgi:hypothetical protein
VIIPPALAEDLALLTEALDADGVDLASMMSLLASAVSYSVPSYLGLSVWVNPEDEPVEITTLAGEVARAKIRTSLRMPFADGPWQPGPAVMIVLYAGLPGAFADLAADLAWLTRRDLGDIGLDVDLGDDVRTSRAISLRARSALDQAMGVLVGRGRTPGAARSELDALAERAGTDTHAAALALLDSMATAGDVSKDTE